MPESSPPLQHQQQALKIHWRLSQGGEGKERTRASMVAQLCSAQPDLTNQVAFARQAERLGFDSLLVDFGLNKPDSTLLAMAIGVQTETIKFIIACRSGVMSPTYFVQQLNTLSHFIAGRFSLNVVAGHSPKEHQAYGDFMDHDQRYARTTEYLTICQQLWQDPMQSVNFSGEQYQINEASVQTVFDGGRKQGPECFIAGSSKQALQLAKSNGDTWISLAQLPDVMKADVAQMSAAGLAVGIRLSVICRETTEQARAAADALVAQTTAATVENNFVRNSDSFGIKQAMQKAEQAESPWLSECLYNGAVKSHGAPAIALVGDPQQIADAIREYQAIGVSQFIFSGWPQYEEMTIFGQQVLPLLSA
ncbi:MAG: LLM class flavin-dependent oxidoreductase [Algicola sp.]|nr:LLM class flavin-dependent oxidoreductase [Algicola sp.]